MANRKSNASIGELPDGSNDCHDKDTVEIPETKDTHGVCQRALPEKRIRTDKMERQEKEKEV